MNFKPGDIVVFKGNIKIVFIILEINLRKKEYKRFRLKTGRINTIPILFFDKRYTNLKDMNLT